MAKIFRSGGPNFPKDKDELEKRLKKVKDLVNKSNANIEFAEAAFKLMEDCDLITEENIKFLSSAQSCESYNYDFRFPRNPNEGALRYVIDDNDVIGGLGKARFYSGNDRRVELNGNHYLISNDWYKDNNTMPNKSAFYNWLAKKATAACEAKWAEDELEDLQIEFVDAEDELEEKDFDEPVAKKVPSENNSETEKLLSNLASLVAMLDIRVDNMEKILSKIEKDIEELKNEWYGK